VFSAENNTMKIPLFTIQVTCALVGILVANAGCSKQKDAKPEALPLRVHCFDLPAIYSSEILASADLKTVYYIAPKGKRRMLVGVDIASDKRTPLADDVETYDVAKDGTIIILRDIGDKFRVGALYALPAGQSNTIPLRPNGPNINGFAIDNVNSRVIYATTFADAGADKRSYISEFTLNLKTEKFIEKDHNIGRAWRFLGITMGVALVYFDETNTGLMSLVEGSTATKLSLAGNESLTGLTTEYVLIRTHANGTPTFRTERLVDDLAEPSAKSDVLWTLESGYKKLSSGKWHPSEFIAAVYDDNTKLYRLTNGVAQKVLTVKGGESAGYVSIGPRSFAFQVCQDTNYNGECDSEDETDVCVAEHVPERETIEIPLRTVPRPMAKVAEKLAPLLQEPDLVGAKMRFFPSGKNNLLVELETPKDSPTDLDALRARGRAVQARVTELSGLPNLEVRIRYANWQSARSFFNEEQRRFLVTGGMGVALVGIPRITILPSLLL
jgi:hypothetical protein